MAVSLFAFAHRRLRIVLLLFLTDSNGLIVVFNTLLPTKKKKSQGCESQYLSLEPPPPIQKSSRPSAAVSSSTGPNIFVTSLFVAFSIKK
jgi:hypothetical protein